MVDFKDIERRMEGAVDNLRGELAGLRAGRASTAMVENIQADAYGQAMPLSQLGTINMPESRLISMQVWDKGLVAAVEKAIVRANLGINPVVEGTLIRLPIPPLSEERRKELVKLSSRAAEQGRIAVRHVRRDGMEKVKAMEKEIGKDEAHQQQARIQTFTDKAIEKIDKILLEKEKDIMQR